MNKPVATTTATLVIDMKIKVNGNSEKSPWCSQQKISEVCVVRRIVVRVAGVMKKIDGDLGMMKIIEVNRHNI